MASGRALLANFFLWSLWLDPMQSGRATSEAYIFLSWYAVLSVAYLLATWNDWWLDRRLGGAAHALDLIIFSFLVFLTDSLSSPYLAFSVFIVLSATMRWSWREATLTAVLIALLFIITALFSAQRAPEASLQPFMIPWAHLVVLSIIIIWFGMNQPGAPSRMTRLTAMDLDTENERPPIRRMLEYMAAQFPNARIMLAWWEAEEPWTHIATLAGGVQDRLQLGPREIPFLIDPDIEETPLLFDLPRMRMLLSVRGNKKLASEASIMNEAFARRFGIQRGLRIPVRTDRFEGEVLILSDLGLSADDLDLAERAGQEISGAFARTALSLATEEAAATRERLSFARDLHDSVVQFLAGISMQLEGIRTSAQGGAGIGAQIDALQKELQLEQRDLRRFITSLRGGRGLSQLSDLSLYLEGLGKRLARQWGVKCDVHTCPPSIQASAKFRKDVDLLVKEALANAVRHGGAGMLSIDATLSDGWLELAIADDGKGFPVHGDFNDAELKERKLGPWSLQERIHKLGGNLHLCSSEAGAKITIGLPMRETA